MYFEVSASSVAFPPARGAPARFPGFALDLDVALGELLRLLLELFVGLLQFPLLGLKFAGKLLRLLQQAFGLHRGLDGIEHDADASR